MVKEDPMRTFPRLVTAVAVAAALVALTACAGPAGAPAPKKAKETVAPIPTRADADLVIWADDARAKVLDQLKVWPPLTMSDRVTIWPGQLPSAGYAFASRLPVSILYDSE